MSALVNAARSYLGTPWQHQGRSRNAIDCLGLLALSERDTGRAVADRTDYARVPNPDELQAGLQAHYGVPVAGAEPEMAALLPGDKLLLRYGRDAQHVAIVTDHKDTLGMIHAYAGANCRVTEHILDDKWRRRIVAVFR